MREPADDMRVAVVGGGWAGCAAALALAERGWRVVLLEGAATLGGRARRVVRDGLALDNGAHLLLGAYTETLRLIERLHGPQGRAAMLARTPLALVPAEGCVDAVTLKTPSLPAPLGLLVGVARARGLSPRERAGVVRWFAALAARGYRRPPGETVAQMLAPLPPRAARGLLAPLCLAALNTPAEEACAQTFANVLGAAFGRRASEADLVLPAADLSALLPDAAAARLTALGSTVELSRRAGVVAADERGVTLHDADGEHRFSAAVVAAGPHRLAQAFAPGLRAQWPALDGALRAVGALRYEPIATVWLGYGEPVPLPAPLLRLDDDPGEWAFERGDVLARAAGAAARLGLRQMLAVVRSASGEHDRVAADTFATAVDAQVRRLVPGLSPARWRQVIRERRATYACTPDRPRVATPFVHPRVVLAGDYLDREFPATLEAAVRSGLAAAAAIEAALRGDVQPGGRAADATVATASREDA